MQRFRIIWDDEDDPNGNVQHIAEHGFTIEDAEHVLDYPESESFSNQSGRPCRFGFAPCGTYIIVVYEYIDDETVYPVTAYEVPEPL